MDTEIKRANDKTLLLAWILLQETKKEQKRESQYGKTFYRFSFSIYEDYDLMDENEFLNGGTERGEASSKAEKRLCWYPQK